MAFQNVKLDSESLSDVESLGVNINRASDANGRPNPLANPTATVIEREVTNAGSVKGFDLATNEDGRVRFVEFEAEETNNQGKVVYSHKAANAFVTAWSFATREVSGATRLYETIELSTGNYTLNAGGEGKTYANERFANMAD